MKWSDSIDENNEVKVCVDVGGWCFFTTHETLQSSTYFREKLTSTQDYIFVDRDASTFSVILNYMRTGEVFLKTEDSTFLNWLKCDATFYGIPSMYNAIVKSKKASDNENLIHELKNLTLSLSKANINGREHRTPLSRKFVPESS